MAVFGVEKGLGRCTDVGRRRGHDGFLRDETYVMSKWGSVTLYDGVTYTLTNAGHLLSGSLGESEWRSRDGQRQKSDSLRLTDA